jgi:hypothetical protein
MAATTSTDTSSKSLYSIEKLKNDSHNYRMWSMRCQMVLKDQGLWGVVNPHSLSSICPSTQIPPTPDVGKDDVKTLNPAAIEWDKKNNTVLTQIGLCKEW